MRVGKVFEDMSPRDDAKAARVAERWIELVIEDSFNRDLDIPEYALGLSFLRDLIGVHLDAALADLCDNSAGVAESIIEVRYTG
jgi:hypothetical protein